jgi:hypothetical protein
MKACQRTSPCLVVKLLVGEPDGPLPLFAIDRVVEDTDAGIGQHQVGIADEAVLGVGVETDCLDLHGDDLLKDDFSTRLRLWGVWGLWAAPSDPPAGVTDVAARV